MPPVTSPATSSPGGPAATAGVTVGDAIAGETAGAPGAKRTTGIATSSMPPTRLPVAMERAVRRRTGGVS